MSVRRYVTSVPGEVPGAAVVAGVRVAAVVARALVRRVVAAGAALALLPLAHHARRARLLVEPFQHLARLLLLQLRVNHLVQPATLLGQREVCYKTYFT